MSLTISPSLSSSHILAAHILASKFSQDKCCSIHTWAKLSGLPPREIGRWSCISKSLRQLDIYWFKITSNPFSLFLLVMKTRLSMVSFSMQENVSSLKTAWKYELCYVMYYIANLYCIPWSYLSTFIYLAEFDIISSLWIKR